MKTAVHSRQQGLQIAIRFALPSAAIIVLSCARRNPPTAGSALASGPEGAAIFQKACAGCHDGTNRAPVRETFRGRTAQSLLAVMTEGSMRYQSLHLTGVQRRAVAEYLSGTKLTTDRTGATVGRCTSTPPFDPGSGPAWNGWGPTTENTHFQPASRAGLTAGDLPHLTLKWAFGFPDSSAAGTQPVVVGGRLFVGSQGGTVYSLDARTGCIYWAFPETSGVRAAISIGPRKTGGGQPVGYNAYFSDVSGNVYALDASSGKLIWQRNVEDNPFARGTGSPVLHSGVLYVPMAGFEEIQAADPTYPCCTFRGSVTALDAATGRVIWKSYTIQEEPRRRANAANAASFGPSGGGTWATPTVDAKRQLLYVTTGNETSGPAQPTTDAVLAFDLKTGRLRWASQVTPGDIWIAGCTEPNPHCPENVGPDDDFGAAAVLATLPNGRDALIAIQKSGVGYALDPDNQGKIIWQYRFGQVKTTGAAQWGVAVDDVNAYFPVSDQHLPHPGGLHAVKLATGERVWKADPQPLKCQSGPGCNAAQQAQPTVIPGVVFSGSMDGALRAYSTTDGSIIWDVDTNHEYSALNGVPARGASLNAAGPIVVGGMLYVTSGYGYLGGRPGNVLLAFGLD